MSREYVHIYTYRRSKETTERYTENRLGLFGELIHNRG